MKPSVLSKFHVRLFPQLTRPQPNYTNGTHSQLITQRPRRSVGETVCGTIWSGEHFRLSACHIVIQSALKMDYTNEQEHFSLSFDKTIVQFNIFGANRISDVPNPLSALVAFNP